MKYLNDTQQFLQQVEQQVHTYIKQMDYQTLNTAADIIQKAEQNGNRLHITGIGKPGHLAGYLASLFSSTGTPAYYLDGTEAIHGSSGQVKKGDVVIAISNSGNTEELKKSIMTIHANNGIVIAVSGGLESWLFKHSDLQLYAGVGQEGDCLNKPPRASILVEMLLLQSLSVLLQYRKQITKQDYIRWHPGGSIGQSICEEEALCK